MWEGNRKCTPKSKVERTDQGAVNCPQCWLHETEQACNVAILVGHLEWVRTASGPWGWGVAERSASRDVYSGRWHVSDQGTAGVGLLPGVVESLLGGSTGTQGPKN